MIDMQPNQASQENAGILHQSSTTDEKAGVLSTDTVEIPASPFYPTQSFSRLRRLGREWNYPSDHLPVAAEVGDLKICSFNVLNAKWVSFFEGDKEGLATSRIVTDHVTLEGCSWTRREEDVLEIACALSVEMGLLLLQECSREFLARLAAAIPGTVRLYPGRLDNPENQIACLVNTQSAVLHVEESSFSVSAFPCRKEYSAMNLRLSTQGGTRYQVFHAHVPGSPDLPGLAEFAQFISANQDPSVVRIAAGDMNFSLRAVEAVFREAGLPSFERLVLGNTSIGAFGELPVAKDIDHILLIDETHTGFPIDLGAWSEETACAIMLVNSRPQSLTEASFGPSMK